MNNFLLGIAVGITVTLFVVGVYDAWVHRQWVRMFDSLTDLLDRLTDLLYDQQNKNKDDQQNKNKEHKS